MDEALGDTIRIRSRPYVPTDKPHVEGAFGLFAQEAPPMILDAVTPEALAQQVAALVVTAWARAVNHRPRLDRDGKSRVDLYRGVDVSPEQIAAARAALLERQSKQRKARQARLRRQDPVVRALLEAAFIRLGLDDPEGHLRSVISSWPLEAIVNGIAIYEGKKKAGTLPEDVDGRYLRGIVKNLAEETEGWQIAEALLRERLAARDLMLAHLGRQRDALEEDEPMAPDLVKAFVDRALASARGIDRTFWLLAAADVITDDDAAQHRTLLRTPSSQYRTTSDSPPPASSTRRSSASPEHSGVRTSGAPPRSHAARRPQTTTPGVLTPHTRSTPGGCSGFPDGWCLTSALIAADRSCWGGGRPGGA